MTVMTVREVRERWADRDCAVGLKQYWWVRYRDRWYLLPKEVGEAEKLPAGSKSAESMMARLRGTVLRCSCCGAIYSPRIVVYGQVGGCRTLIAEEDDGPVSLLKEEAT